MLETLDLKRQPKGKGEKAEESGITDAKKGKGGRKPSEFERIRSGEK
jgi:hypothetical protein